MRASAVLQSQGAGNGPVGDPVPFGRAQTRALSGAHHLAGKSVGNPRVGMAPTFSSPRFTPVSAPHPVQDATLRAVSLRRGLCGRERPPYSPGRQTFRCLNRASYVAFRMCGSASLVYAIIPQLELFFSVFWDNRLGSGVGDG